MKPRFEWLDGRTEAIEIHSIRHQLAHVSWPESRRTVEGSSLFPPMAPGLVNVERPDSWIPLERVTYN